MKIELSSTNSTTAKRRSSEAEPSQISHPDAFRQQGDAVDGPMRYVLLDFLNYQPQKIAGSARASSFHDGLNKVAKGIGLDPHVFLAIALTIVSCTVTSLGLTLQKLSHVEWGVNPDVAGEREVAMPSTFGFKCPYFLRLRWVFGLLVYIVGHMMGFVALGMGPQSILSSLNCWTMIMTFVYGVMLLGEELRVQRVLSSVICILGTLILVYARPASAETLTAPEWFWRLGSVDFLVFLASTCLVGCIVATYISVALRWALLAAALSWLSVTGAKGISGIALAANIAEWQSWVLLFMTVTLAVTNVHFLNMALQRGEITLVVPFYEMAALSGQACVGGVFFREFVSFHSILEIAAFFVGLMLIVCGLISMAGRESGHYDHKDGVQVDGNRKS